MSEADCWRGSDGAVGSPVLQTPTGCLPAPPPEASGIWLQGAPQQTARALTAPAARLHRRFEDRFPLSGRRNVRHRARWSPQTNPCCVSSLEVPYDSQPDMTALWLWQRVKHRCDRAPEARG